MKNLLARFIGARRNQQTPTGGPVYRSATCPPLRPGQIRNHRFSLTRLGRRGLDPEEVHEFLDRVAADLAAAYAAADRGHAEAVRIKNALRRWQTEQINQRPVNYSYR